VIPKAMLGIGARVALFFIVIAGLGWLSNIEPGRRLVVEPVTRASVIASELLIRVFGGSAQADGTLLMGPNTMLNIKDGCNGIIAMILFAGAVVAHDAKAVAKLAGLAIGIPLIGILNLVRIVSLYVVSVVRPSLLDFFHIYFFQTLIIICVVVLWYAWAVQCQRGAGQVARRAPESGPAGASGTTPSGMTS
jgi:exosortase/archaeosortase family protein